jgi:hypothetical protein
MTSATQDADASGGDSEPRGWVVIDIETLRPSDGRPIPFQVFGNRFKSSTAAAELFLHDPLAQMQSAPGDLKMLNVVGFSGEDLALDLEALRDKWHVTTYVANHHRGLYKIYLFAALVVGPDGLHLHLYKDFEKDAVDPA